MKRVCSGLSCHLIIMAGIALMTAPVHAQTFSFQIGGIIDGQFRIPEDVAVDTTTGNIYVADTFNHRIQVFDSQGHFLFKFSRDFGDPNQILFAQAVAVDTNLGHIVVLGSCKENADTCIQVFDRQGNFLFQFGRYGTQLAIPRGMALDASGNIYVVDWWYSIVQVWDAQGNFLRTLRGDFFHAQGVAVDKNTGNVVVAQTDAHLIQVVDSQGNFLRKFGSPGSGDGQLSFPSGVAVDASGNILVADTGNRRIQVFDSEGNFITKFGSLDTDRGSFAPRGVDLDASGNVVVADAGNERIQVFDSVGNSVLEFGDPRLFDYPSAVAVSSSGNIYVADSGHRSIQVFDSQGHFLFKFGEGQLGYDVVGVAVAASANVVVLEESPYDPNGNRGTIQIFDSQGNFLKKVKLPAQADCCTSDYFQGVAVDASDHILVTHTFYDYYTNQTSDVQILDSQGNFLGTFGSASLNFPEGVAVDKNTGNVVVVDTGDNNIVILDSQGGVLRRFGSRGSGDGQFDSPSGAAVDASGNIYITEPAGYYVGNHRIQVFDSQGNFITKFTSFDTDRGVFSPRGVAVDASSGNIVVADSANDGIRVFLP